MQTLLLWLLAMYGITAACIQLGKWLHRPRKKENARYYLLTYNSQSEIEGFIRSLVHWSKLEGREFQIYIRDSGSEDDTIPIIDRLERKGIRVQRIEGKDMQEAGSTAGDKEGTDYIETRAVPCSLTSPRLLRESAEEMVIDLREKRCLSCESKTP